MSVYIFDTETTDRDPGREIIEAAWLQLPEVKDLLGDTDTIPEDLSHVDAFAGRFLPSKPLSFGALAVHHILPEWLVGSPPSSSFRLPDDAAYIIGHSIDFDWEAAGSPAGVKRIDTLGMSQWTWTECDGYSQSALLYYLEGATEATRTLLKHAHGAPTDVLNNLILLRHILDRHPEIRTWSKLWEYSEECRIPRTCPMKKHQGVLLQDLDRSFIFWCLRQDFIDPYYRRGLERVIENDRAGRATTPGDDDDDIGPF